MKERNSMSTFPEPTSYDDFLRGVEHIANANSPAKFDEMARMAIATANDAETAQFYNALRWMLKHLLPRIYNSYDSQGASGIGIALVKTVPFEYGAFALDEASMEAWRSLLSDDLRWSVLNELELVQPKALENRFVFRLCDESVHTATRFDAQLTARHGVPLVSHTDARFEPATAAERKSWRSVRLQCVEQLRDEFLRASSAVFEGAAQPVLPSEPPRERAQ